MSTHFNIAFLGSSSFVIPILDSILDSKLKTLKQLFLEQLDFLDYESQYFTQIEPELWLHKKQDLIKLVSTNSVFEKIPNLEVIISQPDKLNRNKVVSNPVVNFAREKSLELFLPEKINKSKDEFEIKYGVNLDIGITASFGQIVSMDVINMAKFQFINWHPSKLPQYRGPTPMQTGLKNGDTQTALSWIKMTKEMDAGNILLQTVFDILPETDFINLASKMGYLGSKTWALAVVLQIIESLKLNPLPYGHPELVSGSNKFSHAESLLPGKTIKNTDIKSKSQNLDEVVFCKMLDKADRIVDLKLETAEKIFNHFKAYKLFPGTWFEDAFFEEEIKIVECTLPSTTIETKDTVQFGNWLQTNKGKINRTFLICKDQTLLEVSKIIRSNGKQIDFSGFKFN